MWIKSDPSTWWWANKINTFAKTRLYLFIVPIWKCQWLQFSVERVFNCWEVKQWHSGYPRSPNALVCSLNFQPSASTSLRKSDSRSYKWLCQRVVVLICYWSMLIWPRSAGPEPATFKGMLHGPVQQYCARTTREQDGFRLQRLEEDKSHVSCSCLRPWPTCPGDIRFKTENNNHSLWKVLLRCSLQRQANDQKQRSADINYSWIMSVSITLHAWFQNPDLRSVTQAACEALALSPGQESSHGHQHPGCFFKLWKITFWITEDAEQLFSQ